jgi:putative hydrolase of the HAD superfamily
MTTTHLVFDLDDTLYPERSYALSGFRAAAAWAEANHGLTGLDTDMTRLLDDGHLGQIFPMVIAARLGHADEACVKGLMRAFRDHTPEALALFDDAADALVRYGGALGLITDGTHTMQTAKVRALGIAPHFKAIVYTGALGDGRAFHKPHPRAFELIETQLGAPGDRFVYVGDNPSKDFVAPNARGWRTIMVARPEHAEHRIHKTATTADRGEPAHTITTLAALPDVLGF